MNENATEEVAQEQVNIGEGTATENQESEETTSTQEKDSGEPTTFSQDQVNEIIRDRLERDRNAFWSRYGVKNRDEFDELVGQAQSYSVMKERYDAIVNERNELRDKMAFMTNNINPEKEAEIKALFKGLGKEFNSESLVEMLATHPEWLKVAKVDTTPKTTINAIGIEHTEKKVVPETEEEKMKRIFGV